MTTSPASRNNPPERSRWEIQSLLGRTSLLFVAVSAADLFMTYRLLWKARFYESNPIAQFFFSRWNIAGLTLFKFVLVIFIIILAEIIERHRPHLGRLILLLGTVTAVYAAVHGYRLEAEHG